MTDESSFKIMTRARPVLLLLPGNTQVWSVRLHPPSSRMIVAVLAPTRRYLYVCSCLVWDCFVLFCPVCLRAYSLCFDAHIRSRFDSGRLIVSLKYLCSGFDPCSLCGAASAHLRNQFDSGKRRKQENKKRRAMQSLGDCLASSSPLKRVWALSPGLSVSTRTRVNQMLRKLSQKFSASTPPLTSVPSFKHCVGQASPRSLAPRRADGHTKLQ